MNLVKQQEELRMLPIPVLQAKAQGQDPNTPPWLAASVLNERMAAQQKAGLAQGAAQGPQPSVAEQLQQKAGLMALQAQQQQQAQQQMMQQMAQAPQAAPEGVPQPQAQPQAPAMMAGGGIARLPINSQMFNYRHGGIIGFEDGGSIDQKIKEAEEASLKFSGRPLSPQQRATLETRLRQEMAEEAAGAAAGKAGMPLGSIAPAKVAPVKPQGPMTTNTGTVPGGGQAGRGLDRVSYPGHSQAQGVSPELLEILRRDAEQSGLDPSQMRVNLATKGGQTATPGQFGLGQRPAPSAPQAGLPAAAPQAVAPAAPPAEAAPQAGLASLPQAPQPPSEYNASLRSAIKAAEGEQGMTPAQARARYQDLTPDALKQPAGLEQLARLKQQQAQYEKSKESLPMENWMRGLAAAARGGIGGFGYADIENTERGRAADAAQAAYQDKVMTAVEAMRRGEATAEQKALIDMVEKGYERKDKAIASRITGASAGVAAEMEGKKILSSEAIARINAATTNKPGERERVMQKYLELMKVDKNAAEQFMQLYERTSGVTQKAETAEDRNNIARQKLLLGDNAFMYIGAKNVLSDPNATKEQKERAQRTVNNMEQAAGIQPTTGSSTRMRFDAKGNPIP